MSDWAAPDWNLRQQRQEQVGGGDGTNRSSHVQIHQIHPRLSYYPSSISKRETVTHMKSLNTYARSNHGVAELTWENGQLAMHDHGPLKPLPGSRDTLESIVHQATCHRKNPSSPRHDQPPPPSTGGILDESHAGLQCPVNNCLVKKRKRSDPKPAHVVKNSSGNGVAGGTNGEERSICGGGGGGGTAICRDDEVTMRTWASFETPASFKTKVTDKDGSASHGESENQDEDGEDKGEIGPSQSTRRSRASATHNLSEQRRRDRINEKMKALQRLVPNASKTDKASMLDEVIDYLKQLQAQVQMMSLRSNMPQMILPGAAVHQQQLQMSILAAHAAGVGLGMLDINPMAAFVPPPYMVPPLVAAQHFQAQVNLEGRSGAPVLPMPDPYCAYLAQNMNMEHFNNMAALHRQQVRQTAQASRPSQSNRYERE